VANQYENLYGTSSSYGFPTGDTYNLDCGGAQSFEFKSMDLCNPAKFIRVNNMGEEVVNGSNYVMIIDPTSKKIDFKVGIGLSNNIYDKDSNGGYIKNYQGKRFDELVSDDNARLNGQLPFAAFNADFIQGDNKTPFGLDVSRGVEYSGPNKDSQYSLGIGSDGELTIQIGLRNKTSLNYNIIGGYGRFYGDNIFIDICGSLGWHACSLSVKRSLAVTTSGGYLIALVNNDSSPFTGLQISDFKHLFSKISSDNNLGYVKDGLAFDGGNSPAFRYNYNNEFINGNHIGSALLIYIKKQ